MAEDSDKSRCRWCGGNDHTEPECGRLKAVELDPLTQAVTRVEFLTPRDMQVDLQPRQKADGPAETGPAYPKLKPAKEAL